MRPYGQWLLLQLGIIYAIIQISLCQHNYKVNDYSIDDEDDEEGAGDDESALTDYSRYFSATNDHGAFLAPQREEPSPFASLGNFGDPSFGSGPFLETSATNQNNHSEGFVASRVHFPSLFDSIPFQNQELKSPGPANLPPLVKPNKKYVIGKSSYPPPPSDYGKLYHRPSYRPGVYKADATVDGPSIAAATPLVSRNNNQVKSKCRIVSSDISADDITTGRFRRDINEKNGCVECEDPQTGVKYKKCSVGNDDFTGHAQSYSTRGPQRFRREDRDKSHNRFPFRSVYDFDKELEEVRQRSYQAAESNPSYTFDDFESESSKEREISNEPPSKDCVKHVKDSMTCYVCEDKKRGGSYEQCSYAMQPKSSNYLVSSQHSYNSKDKPKQQGQSKSPSSTSYEQQSAPSEQSEYRVTRTGEASGIDLGKLNIGPPEDSSAHSSNEYLAQSKAYEDYFKTLFPELSSQESVINSQRDNSKDYDETTENVNEEPSHNEDNFEENKGGYHAAEEQADVSASNLRALLDNNDHKKDLEEVLGEFEQKDRSSCTKVIKDKMTCYKCIDKQGMQHQECMYVAASQPKASHLAYTGLKQLHPSESKTNTATQSPLEPGTLVTTATIADMEASQAGDHISRARRMAPGHEEEVEEENLKEQEDPSYDGEGTAEGESPDGLYSAETRPQYDPVLKVHLPRYMLTRSEHEATFDEFMASGR